MNSLPTTYLDAADATYQPIPSKFFIDTCWCLKRILSFLVIMLVMTTAILAFNLDLYLAQSCYSQTYPHWPHADQWLWNHIDHLAIYFVWIVLIFKLSMIFLCQQLSMKKLQLKHFIIYLVVLILGPGLIVNLIMKPYFHRSRPRELVEFSGTKHFTPVLNQGDNTSHNTSFPSGHAAVGFMMLVPGFNSRNHKFRAIFFFTIGALWGSLVGFSRMIQGGHFFSDVLYSASIIIALAWSTEMILTNHFDFGEQSS